MSILRVHVNAVWPYPYCMTMSMLRVLVHMHIYVHMSVLNDRVHAHVLLIVHILARMLMWTYNIAWALACSMGTDMKHKYGHAARTWPSSIVITLCNYAKETCLQKCILSRKEKKHLRRHPSATSPNKQNETLPLYRT